jgi:hypothetical protein
VPFGLGGLSSPFCIARSPLRLLLHYLNLTFYEGNRPLSALRHLWVATASLIFYEASSQLSRELSLQPLSKGKTEATSSTDATKAKIRSFVERFPEYRKTLILAAAHEDASNSNSYRGWQWQDVETHPTKLIRLITEGIAFVNFKSRHASNYLLRDRSSVKDVLLEKTP